MEKQGFKPFYKARVMTYRCHNVVTQLMVKNVVRCEIYVLTYDF
jgi:hypothetical protein